jgi:hypothetical protein
MSNNYILGNGYQVKKAGKLKDKPTTKQEMLIERFEDRLKHVKSREQRVYLEQLICDIKDNKKEVINRFKLVMGGAYFGYTEE